MRVTAAELGISHKAFEAHDLWNGQMQRITDGIVSALVEKHGVAMFRITNGMSNEMKWLPFPNDSLQVCGLPWFAENSPDLDRFPKRVKADMPKGVQKWAPVPDGGRIRFKSDTSSLGLRVQLLSEPGRKCHLDAYVGGAPIASVILSGTGIQDLILFKNKARTPGDITIYLPNVDHVRVFAVGVDSDAKMETPEPFARKRPLVCYGSSVLQGTGASRAAMSYPAALARKLNLDFVNLGFAGSGKAEPEVVSLVSEIDGCGYFIDLGKSYGRQPIEIFGKMLDTIRAAHPDAPVFVVTPIYSLLEPKDANYKKLSDDLRELMRTAVEDRVKAGDKHMFVIEGLDICSEKDSDAFHDNVHPDDEGNARIAERLAPIIEKALSRKPK
jgi:lysophospholipase L1-like esterase